VEYLAKLGDFIEAVIRPVLLIAATLFSLIFAFRKVDEKIEVTYKVGFEKFSHPRVLSLILSNRKDKPVSIYAIYALFEGECLLELEKFDPPLILKSLETSSLKTPEYSKLFIDQDQIKPNLTGLIDIYVETTKKLVKCGKTKKLRFGDEFTEISKEVARFGNIVFDENIKFILQYSYNKTTKIAVFHVSGHIGGEWNFGSLNNLGCEPAKDNVKAFLDEKGVDNFLDNYIFPNRFRIHSLFCVFVIFFKSIKTPL
jgi:hypothetical protein